MTEPLDLDALEMSMHWIPVLGTVSPCGCRACVNGRALIAELRAARAEITEMALTGLSLDGELMQATAELSRLRDTLAETRTELGRMIRVADEASADRDEAQAELRATRAEVEGMRQIALRNADCADREEARAERAEAAAQYCDELHVGVYVYEETVNQLEAARAALARVRGLAAEGMAYESPAVLKWFIRAALDGYQ